MGGVDLLERGLGFLRWSFLLTSADALAIAVLMVLSLLITPLATYIFTVILSYFLVISTVVPYALIVILWFMSFRDLARYSRRYSVGLVGSALLAASYFVNLAYMGYLAVNVFVGNILVPKPLFTTPIVITHNSLFIVFSLYLPLPVFISLVLGVVGSVLSMVALYRVGSDFRSGLARLGSLLSIVGALLIESPLFGITLIGVGTALLYIGLGAVITNVERLSVGKDL